MKRILWAALVAATLVPASLALACGKDCDCKHDKAASADAKGTEVASADKAAFKLTTIAEVASLSKAQKVSIFDANNAEFRTKNGVIPGAKLLSSYNGYDVAKELPASKDSKLVFYCANTKCTASHEAAQRAVTAGYTDVSVLPDGLLGWKSSGQPTASPTPKS